MPLSAAGRVAAISAQVGAPLVVGSGRHSTVEVTQLFNAPSSRPTKQNSLAIEQKGPRRCR